MSDAADGELKVRDLLRSGTLEPWEPSLGQVIARRVGIRGWERPNVCISARLYKKFGLGDPWNPNRDQRKDAGIALGPVALKLGAERRQPAPHLKPKEPKKQKSAQAVDPIARFRKMADKPRPTPTPAPRRVPTADGGAKGPKAPPLPRRPNQPGIQPAAKKPSKLSGEFGGGSERPPLRAPLPVRPDLEAAQANPVKRPERARSKGIMVDPADRWRQREERKLRERQEREAKAARSAAPPPGGEPASASPPRPRPPGPPGPRKRAGRFSMKPTQTRAPVVRSAPQVVKVVEPTADKPAVKPKEPVSRKPPTKMGGMDDFFGAAMEAGRMSIRRSRSKKADADKDKGS